MKYLLDTCVLSETIKPNPHPSVASWVRNAGEDQLYLSILTLGELWRGVLKLPISKKRKILESWCQNDIVQRFEGRILPIDLAVIQSWAELTSASEKSGRPLPTIDSLISATAIAHHLVLVTRDTTGMGGGAVTIINPWGETDIPS